MSPHTNVHRGYIISPPNNDGFALLQAEEFRKGRKGETPENLDEDEEGSE